MQTTNIKFNEMQLAAINGREEKKVIVAPAGSGKTSTIIGAIRKHRTDYPNDHIVAITFTKKATGELVDRIGVMPNIEISTIHSWSWRRLTELSNEYGFKVQLLEDEAIKDILKVLCNKRRQFYINQYLLFSYVMGNYNIDVDDGIKKIYEIIRCDYIKFKKKNKLYDFTDLPEYLYDKLDEYSEDIKGVDALFVDEFQDIDPVQLQLFDKVICKWKCYIGDPAQAIYAFRGAVEEVFDELDGFRFYNLNVNYRSYQEILDFASTMRDEAIRGLDFKNIVPTYVEDIYPSDIVCERGEGGNVYNIPAVGECMNLARVDENCSDILTIKRLINDKGTQILCRSNKQVKKLLALGIENVSTVHQAKGLEYDNVILTDFICSNMEEVNIAYVGATRAKNNLCVIDYETLLYIVCQEDIKQSNKLF